jgi:hypothetical protein
MKTIFLSASRAAMLAGLASAGLIAVASIVAQAAPVMEFGRVMSWEKQADGQNYQNNFPWAARGGWDFDGVDALIEYSTYSRGEAEPGNEAIYVERQALAWGRKVFAARFRAKPYVGLGVGGRVEEIRERFFGQSYTAQGKPVAVGAIAGGAYLPIALGFIVEGEARLTASPGYAPNPQLSASAYLGYRF